jgi:hypothetical protein
MLGTRRAWTVRAGILAAAIFITAGPIWSKGSRQKDATPALWIAADRVSGFAPLTVTLYGKVAGAVEPGRIELCRDVANPVDIGMARGEDDDPMMARTDRRGPIAGPSETVCSTGTLTRTQNGFSYSQEVRFDRAGTYRVRLTTVDATGHRAISNTVQVNAF